MGDFRWKTYELTSPKIKEESGGVRFCFLSDLHSFTFGENNCELIRAIKEHRPDGILVGGDCIVSKSPVDFGVPLALLAELSEDFPIWYALGNHEYRLCVWPERYEGETYLSYEEELRGLGVHFLRNEGDTAKIRGSRISFYGLELPCEFFQKPRAPKLSPEKMKAVIRRKEPDRDTYSILLAHNPRFGETYFEWGSDLILSGHYHGGILRFNEHHGLAAPQDLLLPKYCCGDFYRGKQVMIVSAGLGEHTLPLRIHNPREVLEIVVSHEQNESLTNSALPKGSKASRIERE